MTSLAETGTATLATAFGLLMAGAAAVGTHGLPLAAAAAAVIAVGAGIVFRPAATIAVLLAVATIVLAGPPQLLAALSGLCAAAYLVCRHAVGPRPAAVLGSWPTIAAAVGFTFVGLVATSFPVQVPWLPLVAPLAVLTIYVVATRPFLN
ncbi:uncharacterized protein MRAB57_209 [Mycobacterium rhizamassiliense]|uniref:Integral membrane protein n=1 Tax=Mycobacterium rhizamassiliense TaxID=1841860 RepID=A0A2U3NLL0_9MYCO|nr:hypothetical protein [Mycobacterium rhizamassiliense]SPM32411.1 uncharacterized protein MRAB57_209 [Mycobacterium rhizamassiliense]